MHWRRRVVLSVVEWKKQLHRAGNGVYQTRRDNNNNNKENQEATHSSPRRPRRSDTGWPVKGKFQRKVDAGGGCANKGEPLAVQKWGIATTPAGPRGRWRDRRADSSITSATEPTEIQERNEERRRQSVQCRTITEK